MRRFTDVTEYRAVRQARQKAANAAAAAANSEQRHQQASAKSVSCVGLDDTVRYCCLLDGVDVVGSKPDLN